MTKKEDQTLHSAQNNLKAFRQKAGLTQHQLVALCSEVAAASPAKNVSVGLSTIKKLERGTCRPKLSTASTLAQVLNTDSAALFPDGLDDPNKNPAGKTGAKPKPAKES